jgi:hypothetical protein
MRIFQTCRPPMTKLANIFQAELSHHNQLIRILFVCASFKCLEDGVSGSSSSAIDSGTLWKRDPLFHLRIYTHRLPRSDFLIIPSSQHHYLAIFSGTLRPSYICILLALNIAAMKDQFWRGLPDLSTPAPTAHVLCHVLTSRSTEQQFIYDISR